MQKKIPGSEFKIFENSAHMGMLEDTDDYVATLRDFMRRAEAA
jgi:proline iminopeptidase